MEAIRSKYHVQTPVILTQTMVGPSSPPPSMKVAFLVFRLGIKGPTNFFKEIY